MRASIIVATEPAIHIFLTIYALTCTVMILLQICVTALRRTLMAVPSKSTQYLLRSQRTSVVLHNMHTDSNNNNTGAPLPTKKKAENSKGPAKRIETIVLQEADIEERHVRGWGNGGQKLNKTSSCVQLLHKPTNTTVVCQDTRSLQQNRKIAFKRLKDKLDLQVNGSQSKIGKKIEKLRARKHKQRQRAKKKYHQEKDQISLDSFGKATEKSM